MANVSLFSLMGKIAVDGVEKTTKDLQEVSKSGKDAEGKLSVSFSSIANKAGELGRKAALGIAGVGAAALGAVEGTKEFRQDLGRLEAGYNTVGYSSNIAKETFKGLYAILGEDDTAIEASNLMKELAKDEQGLAEWTDIATGVYARFPDSIPIEALIESANETAKVGQITGNLADAINWAKASNQDWQKALGGNQGALNAFNKAIKDGESAEDAFNAALAKCNSETEREELLRSTMNTLYGKSADEYKKVNGSVMDNNKAQAELNLKMAEIAEKIEPIITKGKILLAEVLEKMSPVLEWIINNINVLAPIVLSLVGGLLAMGIAGKIASFINTIKTLKTAFSALNLTMSLNPIGLIITLVAGLVAAFIHFWNTSEEFRNFWIGLWETIKNALGTSWEWIKGVFSSVAEWINTNVIQPVIGFFQGLWAGIQAVWDGIVLGIQIFIGIVVSIFQAAFDLITLPFRFIWENCKDTIMTVFNVIKDFINNAINTIKNIIETIFNAIKDFFTTVWNGIKNIFTTVWNAIVNFITPIINKIKDIISTVFNAIKNTISNIFNSIKNVVTTVWNAIVNFITPIVNKIKDTISKVFNGIKNTVSNIVNGIKSTISNVFNGIKNTATSVWNGIKNAITKPIEKARDIIKGIVDKIKGFFKFNITLPKIKLPHFSIKPSGWQIGDLLQGSIPKLGIDWYAKAMNSPMLLEEPTAFGFSSSGNIRVGGEAGDEIVGGASTIMGMIGNAVSSNNTGLENKLDKLINLLSYYLPTMQNQQVVLSTGELVGAIVSPLDKAMGELAENRKRGR